MKYNKNDWLNSVACSAREKALLARAYDTLAGNTIDTPDAPWAPYRCISPWIGNNVEAGIWNWDSAFHAMACAYFDEEQAKDCLKGFMQYQLPNGMFPDVIFLSGTCVDGFTKPPVLPWSALTVYEKCGDKEFLRWCYDRFTENEAFWVNERKYGDLFHYSSQGTPEKIAENDYLHARYESGWDNSPRWDAPVIDYWPIDLNCFMVTFYRSMSRIAAYLGEVHTTWDEKAVYLTEAILKNLYDTEHACFADKNFRTGAFSTVITPASFMPLFIKIATKEQAEAMHRIGSDPERFYPGMPSVSYDDPTYSTGYWRGPTWLNIAYFAAKGMKNYGYTETADGIREFILSMVEENADGIYENYNSKERRGMYWHSFSWSACFVIEFVLNW